ncbi:MAG: DUF3037 domain-containing protein [bacterium]|nr:DUF3037 domain-containing protein [bacterium]
MEKILKYSVLRYSPSSVSGEKINLGIIFFDETLNYREFRYSKKFSRLSSFDDEININLVKKLLQSIKDEVEGNLFTYNKFDIDEYIKYYVNDFCFDKPKSIKYEVLEEMTERLHKAYFRFDYDKSQRPSKSDDKKLIEQLICTQGKSCKKDFYVYGRCNDKIKYDIVTEDYNIKIFDFEDKQLSLLINNAKTWAWNTMFGDDKKSIIIYRYNDINSKYSTEFKIIMNIFKNAQANVYDIEEGMQFLQNTLAK